MSSIHKIKKEIGNKQMIEVIPKHVDVYCAGSKTDNIPWGELEKIRPDIKRAYQEELELKKRYYDEASIQDITYVKLSYGWYCQWLCVINEEHCNSFKNAFQKIRRFAQNQNYKHQIVIRVFPETFVTDKETIKGVIRDAKEDKTVVTKIGKAER